MLVAHLKAAFRTVLVVDSRCHHLQNTKQVALGDFFTSPVDPKQSFMPFHEKFQEEKQVNFSTSVCVIDFLTGELPSEKLELCVSESVIFCPFFTLSGLFRVC